MSKEVHLIIVGKLKNPHLESVESAYLKRLVRPALILHEVKSRSLHPDDEAKNIYQKIQEISKDSPRYIVVLDERGKTYTSHEFSNWFFQLLQTEKSKIVFIIGGSEGLHKDILEMSHETLSLSSLTFPHKLARIFLIEQLYRAQSIHFGHPYHH